MLRSLPALAITSWSSIGGASMSPTMWSLGITGASSWISAAASKGWSCSVLLISLPLRDLLLVLLDEAKESV